MTLSTTEGDRALFQWACRTGLQEPPDKWMNADEGHATLSGENKPWSTCPSRVILFRWAVKQETTTRVRAEPPVSSITGSLCFFFIVIAASKQFQRGHPRGYEKPKHRVHPANVAE